MVEYCHFGRTAIVLHRRGRSGVVYCNRGLASLVSHTRLVPHDHEPLFNRLESLGTVLRTPGVAEVQVCFAIAERRWRCMG